MPGGGCHGGRRAMAATMIGVCLFYLASAYLIAGPMSPNPQTTQKPTTVPPHISVNNGRMGTFQVSILCACMVRRHICHMKKRFFHLEGGGSSEASETMAELFLWPFIILLCKLVVYCILRTIQRIFMYWEKIVKSTVIPSKSHSVQWATQKMAVVALVNFW